MMQNVAPAKSEVAAFAALSEQTTGSSTDVSFEQVFQQQAGQYSSDNRSSSKKQLPSVRAECRQPSPSKLAKADDPVLPQSERSQATVKKHEIDNNVTQQKSIDNTQIRASDEELNALTLAEKTGEQENLIEQDENEAQEWLALVAALKEMSDNEASAETIVESNEYETLIEEFGDIDEALMALKLLDIAPSLPTVLGGSVAREGALDEDKIAADAQMDDQSAELSLENFAKDISTLVENGQFSAEELKLIDKELTAITKNQLPSPWLVDLVHAKLEEKSTENLVSLPAISNSKTEVLETLTDEIQSKLAKLLLAGESLSHSSSSKSNVTDSADTKAQSIGGKVAQSEQSVENAALSPSDIKGNQAAASPGEIVDDENNALPKTPSILTSEQGVDKKPSLEVKAAANSSGQLKDTLVSPSEATKTIDGKELNALLSLPEEKLNEALTSISQRVANLVADEAKQQGKLGNISAETSKDVLAALKAGVAEFKEQLAAGREPGIDLKALVAQAISQSTDAATSTKIDKSIEQTLAGLTQALSLATQMTEAADRSQALDASHDNQMLNLEPAKLQSYSQVESKLEKAINLTKPEAHQQLAEKVRWMVNTNNLIAEIRLDPAELGSMHVKVSLSADSATVNFVVQSHQTRDALESATPRLREMLAEKGIELGQASVRQDNQTKDGNQEQSNQSKGNGTLLAASDSLNEEDGVIPQELGKQRHAEGGIDYFV